MNPRYTFNPIAGSDKIDILQNGTSIAQGGPGFSSSYAQTLGYQPAQTPAATLPAVPPPTGPQTQAPQPITLAADSVQTPSTLANVPSAPVTPNYSSTLAAIPTAESILNGKSDAQIADEGNATSLQTRILSVLGALGGKSAATTAADTATGVPDLTARLADVNSQILALQNEEKAIPIQDQQDATGRGITAAGLQPIDDAKLRDNTIQALGLSSIAATLQGNLGLAEAQSAKAVAAQFDPLQAELDYLKQAYDFNTANMSADDKAQATVIAQKLQDRQSQIDDQRAEATTILKTRNDAAANGAPIDILNKAGAPGLSSTDVTHMLAAYLPQTAKYQTVAKGSSVFDPISGQIIEGPADNGSGGGSFSQTQINKGAANAGIPVEQFNTLDADSKNYLINSFTTFKAQQKLITSGQQTAQQVAHNIVTSTTIPTAAQDVLLGILGVSRADASTGAPASGGIWNGIKSAVGTVGSWLGF